MKSTLKKTEVLGLPFFTGEVSIEDFEVQPDTENIHKAKPQMRGFQTTFSRSSASWSCFYRLPEELVAELRGVNEFCSAFGAYGKLEHLGRRVRHAVDAKIERIRKEENAQKRCDKANEELDRWLKEDKQECIVKTLEEVVEQIHRTRDKVNEVSTRLLAEHVVTHIDDDDEELSILTHLKELGEKCRRALDDAEQRELAERKRLTIEWLKDKSGVPEELRGAVEEKVNGRAHLHNTIGRF